MISDSVNDSRRIEQESEASRIAIMDDETFRKHITGCEEKLAGLEKQISGLSERRDRAVLLGEKAKEDAVFVKLSFFQLAHDSLAASLGDIKRTWCKLGDREVGSVFCYPELVLGVSHADESIGFTQDWGLAVVDPAKVEPSSSLNRIILDPGPASILAKEGGLSEAREGEDFEMLPLIGTMTIAEISENPGLLVFMRGCISGSTVGRVNGIETYCRKIDEASEESKWTKELAVLGYDADRPFSKKGDSGSGVFSKDGKLVGMLHAGNPTGRGGRHDVSYVIPWPVLADQMIAFGLLDPQPILVGRIMSE